MGAGGFCYHDCHVRSSQNRSDQCALPTFGTRGHAHREDVIAGDFNAQLGLWTDSEKELRW